MDGKKQNSGAKNRKIAAARLEAELKGELGGAEAYDCLGDPDLSDPDTILEYSRKALAISLGQICRSRKLSQLTRWRQILEHTKALGMTHNRGKLEAKTRKIEQALEERQQAGTVDMRPFSSLEKSPLARGGPLGPRLIESDGENDGDATPED